MNFIGIELFIKILHILVYDGLLCLPMRPFYPAINGVSDRSFSSFAGEKGLIMPERKAYRFFLGANSPDGFHSFYDQLIDLNTAKEVIIIKGGPGSGKSSFMKRAAAPLTDAGYLTEYISCSADPDSLDGIIFPELGLAFVDGTQPHAVVSKTTNLFGPAVLV